MSILNPDFRKHGLPFAKHTSVLIGDGLPPGRSERDEVIPAPYGLTQMAEWARKTLKSLAMRPFPD